MTVYRRITCLGVQATDDSNRITIVLVVDDVERVYSVNQRVLERYETEQDLIDAVVKFLGYWPEDLWVHLNRDGTWAIATGPEPPAVWPEDEVFPEPEP